jgi:prepilin-type processing-associated H-X9-DG protein
VADEYAGRSGPCSRCGQTITVPFPPKPGGSMGTGTAVAAGTAAAGIGVVVIVIIVGVLLALLVCGGILAALLLPAVQAARQAAIRARCQNNLMQISLALQMYEDTHGTLPPAYIPDASGKPMHSWRVLILPFLEEGSLHSQYDFNQPWDSPKNLALAQQMPKIYSCPTGDPSPDKTPYQVIVGQQTMFPGPRGVRSLDIRDGMSLTIAVVEASGSPVTWTQPQDLEFDRLSFSIGSGQPGQLDSEHRGGINAAFADGSVRFLDENNPPDQVRAAATRAGGETVNLNSGP